MKTYRETSDEVFEKIGKYERTKKYRRRIALKACGTVAAFALVLSLPVAFFLQIFGGGYGAGKTDGANEAVPPEYSAGYDLESSDGDGSDSEDSSGSDSSSGEGE